MVVFRLLRPSPARLWAEAAFAAVNAAAREPVLYGPQRTPDTPDKRFELLVLHGAAAFLRLKAAKAANERGADRLGDAFADRFFRSLDDSLRELGVGVLSVPRKMKALARSVYGRIQAYEAALGSTGDAALIEAIARNVFDAPPEDAPYAAALAARFRACLAALAAAPAEQLAQRDLWPAP